jgi:hypothetical protein
VPDTRIFKNIEVLVDRFRRVSKRKWCQPAVLINRVGFSSKRTWKTSLENRCDRDAVEVLRWECRPD